VNNNAKVIIDVAPQIMHYMLYYSNVMFSFNSRRKARKDLIYYIKQVECRNPSFGLATKAKRGARVRAKRRPGVTSHTPGSVRKCEGVNPHTPK
jgi:hypothetical protein